MTNSIFLLEVTIVILFALGIRIKIWKKSITVFTILLTGIGLVILHYLTDQECFLVFAPIILSAALFFIMLHAILKEPGDKFAGGFRKGCLGC